MAYINQIDDILDSMLDNLGYELDNDTTFKIMSIDKEKNYVEYFEKINNFILEYKSKINTDQVSLILNDKKHKRISLVLRTTKYLLYTIFYNLRILS